jgi:hypothetical protein
MVSVGTITFIALDRYLTIVRHCGRDGRPQTRRRVVLSIALIWLLAAAVTAPVCYFQVRNRCDSNCKWEDHDDTFMETSNRFLSYLTTLFHLRRLHIVYFYIATPRCVGGYQCFGGNFCLDLQGRCEYCWYVVGLCRKSGGIGLRKTSKLASPSTRLGKGDRAIIVPMEKVEQERSSQYQYIAFTADVLLSNFSCPSPTM